MGGAGAALLHTGWGGTEEWGHRPALGCGEALGDSDAAATRSKAPPGEGRMLRTGPRSSWGRGGRQGRCPAETGVGPLSAGLQAGGRSCRPHVRRPAQGSDRTAQAGHTGGRRATHRVPLRRWPPCLPPFDPRVQGPGRGCKRGRVGGVWAAGGPGRAQPGPGHAAPHACACTRTRMRPNGSAASELHSVRQHQPRDVPGGWAAGDRRVTRGGDAVAPSRSSETPGRDPRRWRLPHHGAGALVGTVPRAFPERAGWAGRGALVRPQGAYLKGTQAPVSCA